MKIGVTRTFSDLVANNGKRVVVLEGGSRSGKTWAICQYFAQLVLTSKEDLRILVARQYFSWIKAALLPDFQKVLESFGVWEPKNLNKQDWTYDLNGSKFYFIGNAGDAKGSQKAHGLQSDYVWLNEGIECAYPFVRQLMMRMKKQIVIDFNPNCSPEHWVYAKMISRKDAVLLRSTFKDNPYCPDDIEKEIAGYEPTPENISAGTADAMLWRIYGLGERGVVTGLVFPIIELVSESKMPLTFERQAYGIDFGFSNDATAIVFCGVCNGCLYMREIVYDRGLSIIRNELGTTVKSIQDKLEQANVDRNLKFWCDSVEPRSIEDLKSVGYNAESVKKGSGSIMRGIEIMKRYKIYVQDDSYNLIRELRNYKWKQNADGAFTNEIVGGMDHAIDAARYALLMMMENSGKTYIDSVKMDYGESRYAY